METTRFSIVEQSLADVLERLEELPRSAATDGLRARAKAFEREVQTWATAKPSVDARQELLTKVLDLNVEVIRAGGTRPTGDDGEELDSESAMPTARRYDPTKK
jgi:hypothetical protein